MNKIQTFALADQFFESIENDDMETVEKLYADDVAVWHSFDPLETRATGETKSENLKTLRRFVNFMDDLKYDIFERQTTETGFMQQHVIRGRTRSGKDVAIPVCIVCKVEGGQITRIDEYLDPKKLFSSV